MEEITELLGRLGAASCARCSALHAKERLTTVHISFKVCDQCWELMTFDEKYHEQMQVVFENLDDLDIVIDVDGIKVI